MGGGGQQQEAEFAVEGEVANDELAVEIINAEPIGGGESPPQTLMAGGRPEEVGEVWTDGTLPADDARSPDVTALGVGSRVGTVVPQATRVEISSRDPASRLARGAATSLRSGFIPPVLSTPPSASIKPDSIVSPPPVRSSTDFVLRCAAEGRLAQLVRAHA